MNPLSNPSVKVPRPDKFAGESKDTLLLKDWLYQMSTYVQLTNSTSPVLSAIMNLSGAAATWWTTEGRFIPNIQGNWDLFEAEILKKFTSSADSQKARGLLSGIKQRPNQTVDEYMLKIKQLLARITIGAPPNSSSVAECFYRGLLPNVRTFLAPLIDQHILTDVDRLYAAAQQAFVNLQLTQTLSADNTAAVPAQTERSPTSYATVAAGKRKRKASESSKTAAKNTAAEGNWPDFATRMANKEKWGKEKKCFMCGKEGHRAADCNHPKVSDPPTVPTDRVASDRVAKTVLSPNNCGKTRPANHVATQLPKNRRAKAQSSAHSPTPAGLDSLFAAHSSPLTMLFTGTVAEQAERQEGQGGKLANGCAAETLDVRILLDSGASNNFVSLSVLERMNLMPVYKPNLPAVGLVNDKTVMPLGVCSLVVNLGEYSEVLEFHVLRTTSSMFQLILGAKWCRSRGVDLLHSQDRAVINYGPGYSIPCCIPEVDEISCLPCITLTPLQFKKCLADCEMLCYVTVQAKPSTESTSADPEIAQIIDEFRDVLVSELPSGLPPERTTFHTIPVKDGSVPPAHKLYRLSRLQSEELRRQLKSLTEKRFIQPSSSPYGSPVLFAVKPDGSLRLCVDFRALNKQTVRNRYPLPRIDDLLDKLVGMKYFSSLDLAQAYYQVRLLPSDVPKTAFTTPEGLFEFLVLPFGLTNAPATFQAIIHEVFGDALGKILLAYLDDLLIFSKTREEHLSHLRVVLSKLREHKLYANIKKCHFMSQSVQFLGHVVSGEGIKPSPAKTEIVLKWAVPKTVHDIQSFMGLMNYFRKFIQGYSVLAKPLTDLLKADVPFNWTQSCQNAFELLKQKLTSAPVLILPDNEKHFELICDACKDGLGAVLLQEGRPVCFDGRKFTDSERILDAGEQELLAVIYALHKFRCYLEGNHFTLVTDHLPNTYFASQLTLSPKKARWLDFLSRFDFDWSYRPGRLNVADPLSRAKHLPTLSLDDPNLLPLFVAFQIDNDSSWQTAYAKDPWFSDPTNTEKLSFKGEKWYNASGQIVVPNALELRELILKECHDAPTAGHPGVARTVKLITVNYWWPHLFSDVKNYIKFCPLCQSNKAVTTKKAGLLSPTQAPKSRWQIVGMDFVTALPVTARGYSAILVVIDKLTKMVRLIPCTENVGAKETAELFLRYVFKDHGMPSQFITDRGTQFTGTFFKTLCTLLGTTQHMSTANHPESDGQTERANRVMEEVLRHYVAADQADWDKYLPLCEFAINNSWNESTKSTPFYLNYGRHPRVPVMSDPGLAQDLYAGFLCYAGSAEEANVHVLLEQKLGKLLSHEISLKECLFSLSTVVPKKPFRANMVPAATEFAHRMQAKIKMAKQFLQTARSRMKTYADASRLDVRYSPQDLVLLNCSKLVFPKRSGNKLQPKWIGPFPVISKIGRVAYNETETAKYHENSPCVPCELAAKMVF